MVRQGVAFSELFSWFLRLKPAYSRWLEDVGIHDREISRKVFFSVFGEVGRRSKVSCRVRGRVNVHHREPGSEGLDWNEATSDIRESF